jgi:ABC-2 type transport system ATP-binding protein
MIEARALRKVFRGEARWRQLLRGRMRGDEIVALDGVDLQIFKGQVLEIMGPNGAGKSTLLRILAGLIVPTSGELALGGSVAFVVADERSFSWRLTGRHNLEFFANLYGYEGEEARDRIAIALDRTNLAREADRPFREYSTGMRQRMALARGLLADAQIYLLDEPTRGVDPESAQMLRRYVKEELVERGGRTVVLATHDLLEARTLAGHVAMLRDGRIERMVDAMAVPDLFLQEAMRA